MSDVASSTLNVAQKRFQEFVLEQRRESPWPGIKWNSVLWHLPKDTGSRRIRLQNRLWFTTDSTESVATDAIGTIPAMPTEFADFIKASIVIKARTAPTTFSQYTRMLRVGRRLLKAMSSRGIVNPSLLTSEDFSEAESEILKSKLSLHTKWIHCRGLVALSNIVDLYRLSCFPIKFKSQNTKIPQFREGVSEDAQEKSLNKLPSLEALEALGTLFHRSEHQNERIFLDLIAILACGGFRMGEGLTIPVDCEVEENGRYGIRYWPEKGGEPVVKWMSTHSVEVAKRAIGDLRVRCQDARGMAAWLEAHPGKVKVDWENYPDTIASDEMNEILSVTGDTGFFWLKQRKFKPVSRDPSKRLNRNEVRTALANDRPALISKFDKMSPDDLVSINQLIALFGTSRQSVGSWLKRRNIFNKTGPGFRYLKDDIKTALLKEVHTGPIFTTQTGRRQFLSECLIVVFENEMHPRHFKNLLIPRQLAYSTIRYWLGEKGRTGSIFEKYGLSSRDGTRLSVRSHQFRHWLSTLAHLGGMSEVEAARWMGRKNLASNAAYQHGTVLENKKRAREMIRERKMAGPIADIYHDLPVETREKFIDTAIGAVFTMPTGGCMHNFASRPCPKFMACLSGCSKYHRTIGDPEERRILQQELTFINRSITTLEEALSSDETVSNFLKNLMERRDGIIAALSIDETFQSKDQGKMSAVFPNGRDLSVTDTTL